MKNEREIAELIFDTFRKTNCKTGEIVPMRTIRFGLNKIKSKRKRNIFLL